MMQVARQLAAVAPSDRERRILARYVLLQADMAHSWTNRWNRELKDSPESRERARAAKAPLSRLRVEFKKQKAVATILPPSARPLSEGVPPTSDAP